MNIYLGKRRGFIEPTPERTRPAFCLVREKAAVGAFEVRGLAAQAIVDLRQDSDRCSPDRRRYFQLPAGARTLDAAARTPFVRAGRAAAAEADGAGARMDRAQMDRAATGKTRARAHKRH